MRERHGSGSWPVWIACDQFPHSVAEVQGSTTGNGIAESYGNSDHDQINYTDAEQQPECHMSRNESIHALDLRDLTGMGPGDQLLSVRPTIFADPSSGRRCREIAAFACLRKHVVHPAEGSN